MIPAAWHPDPTGKHELRYWDGNQWTEHVANAGVQATDPLDAPADSGGAHAAGGAHASFEPESGQGGADQVGEADMTVLAPHRPQSGGADPAAAAEPAAEEPVAEEGAAEGAGSEVPTDTAPSAEQSAGREAPVDAGAAAEPAPAAAPMPQQQPSGPPPQQPPQQSPFPATPGGAPAAAAAGITGDLIDGTYGETSSAEPGASLQNSKLLRVRLGEPFLARQGSMVAYQGPVDFQYQGGGAAKYLKKAMTGEGLSLMQVTGQGDVFIADTAKQVHLLHLNNSGISINGSNVLAFSASLQWDIERVKGGSMAAGGLFNTSLRGTGWVAITTDGDPVVLNAAEAPTFADAQALVAWSIDLQTSIRSTFKASSLIGRGSGEAFQVAFNGHGFVIVQPSEGYPMPAQ